jgi:hypothetical protein
MRDAVATGGGSDCGKAHRSRVEASVHLLGAR